MRILNVAVEQVGLTQDGRNVLVALGRDVVSGWTIGFVVLPAQRDKVVAEVRAGRRPVVPVPEANALPWASVSHIDWE
jgi:phage head maturation protease